MTLKPTPKLVLILVGVFAAIGLVTLAIGYGISLFTGLLAVHTRFIPGDSHRFDPLAHLNEVRTQAGAGQLQFISMLADGVTSDGTIDIRATYTPPPDVEYLFSRTETSAPKDARPVITASGTEATWVTPVYVHIHQPYKQWSVRHVFRSQYSFMTLGMDREESAAQTDPAGVSTQEPTCHTVDLWNIAIANGAPAKALAEIEYNAKGYSFSIPDTKIQFTFNTNCELIPKK